jgi:glycosyltransferase involved in cell wall biosynthesis
MRIVIDLQGAQTASQYRGIGRYSMNLALAIARNRGDHEIWLALNGAFPETVTDIRRAFRDLIPAKQIRVFNPPLPVAEKFQGTEWRTRSAELIREFYLAQLQPDIVLVTGMIEGYEDDAVTSVGSFIPGNKIAAVLYDLIPLLNQKEYMSVNSFRDYYYRKLEHLRNSGLLLAISENTRQEALASPELESNLVVNISAAVDSRFRPLFLSKQQKRDFLDSCGIKKNVILYAPGGFDKRKNFGRLFQAYAELPQKLRHDFQLIITGKAKDEDREILNHLKKKSGLKKDELVLTGYVSDENLVTLYNSAAIYVHPSLHEGFGLPILEAMACGTPVIGSNTSSIPDIIGCKDAHFDPESTESIKECLVKFLQDENNRAKLREHGLKHAKKFSWDTTARTALRACEDLHSKPAPEIQKALWKTNHQSGAEPNPFGDSRNECLPPYRETLLQAIAEIKDLPPEEESLRQLSRSIATSVPPETTQKQLLVDISSIFKEDIKTGIQRVVRAQLFHLLHNPPAGFSVEPVYLNQTGDEWQYRYARSFLCDVLGFRKLQLLDEPADLNMGDILYMPDLCPWFLLQAEHAGFFQQLKNRGLFISSVVHDLLPVFRPDFFTDGIDICHEKWLEAITGFSNQIICVSGSVASEYKTWLNQKNPGKDKNPAVHFIHHGADIESSVPSRGLPENIPELIKTKTEAPCFIMVGTLEPRKGHLQVIRAFDLLWADNKDVNLIFIGKECWTHLPDIERRTVPEIMKTIRNHGQLNKRLFWLGGASDELLQQAYEASNCLIFASEGEGFGLPLIEGVRHGLPIIARDIPVFREIAGNKAHYFRGLEPEALAAALLEWLSLYQRGEHPASTDIKWITWAENVEQLKEILTSDY